MPSGKRASVQPDFLEGLIKTGYLPTEIPPVVTSRYFAAFCKNNFKHFQSIQSTFQYINTNYDTFSVPRPNTGRRNLALVNPVAQLGLSLLLTEHRSLIKKRISKNGISMYRTTEDVNAGKAFEGLDFNQWHRETHRISSEYRFAVKADISRFFYTIYTHSIPWALIGKEKAKSTYKSKRFKNHWTNKLDMVLQSCQSRETFGIPVGPDTSRIIAELLMAGIEDDKELTGTFRPTNTVRLIDDLYVGCDNEDSANRILGALKSALWRFNLQLNEDKSYIQLTHQNYEEKWRYEFDDLEGRQPNAKLEEKQIRRIIDVALHHCQETGTEKPSIWACRRLMDLNHYTENHALLVEVFFRLGRDFPSTTKHVAEFIINNRFIFLLPEMRTKLKQWLREFLRFNSSRSSDLELAWALLISGVFAIKLTEHDLEELVDLPGSVTFAILGLLREHGLLDVPLGNWPWKSRYKESGIYGPNWLPIYEATLRGWTKDKALISQVTGNPHFNRMLQDKVTFLEDDFLKIGSINFPRRRYRVCLGRKLSSQSFALKIKVDGAGYD